MSYETLFQRYGSPSPPDGDGRRPRTNKTKTERN